MYENDPFTYYTFYGFNLVHVCLFLGGCWGGSEAVNVMARDGFDEWRKEHPIWGFIDRCWNVILFGAIYCALVFLIMFFLIYVVPAILFVVGEIGDRLRINLFFPFFLAYADVHSRVARIMTPSIRQRNVP